MKRFVYTTCSYANPHMGVLLNEILSSVDDGDKIYWGHCRGILSSCMMNPNGNSLHCRLCRLQYKSLIKRFGKRVEVVPFIHKENIRYEEIAFSSIEEIKKLEYRGVRVGLSILSYYFSITRNVTPDITFSFCRYINCIASDMFGQIDALYDFIDKEKPDVISIYNGRLYESRALYDIAIIRGIKFESLEIIGGMKEPAKMVKYDNVLPHDIGYFAKKANWVWEVSKDTDEEKERIASDFFVRRRNGIQAGDKVYVADQIKGKLPENMDSGKMNVMIFNSSADELAALGGEWDKDVLFNSQYEAIDYMLSHSSSAIHYYLRIHPNLKDVPYRFVTELYGLSKKHTNITIIEPSSNISSYALLDAADKVVVFGSTMGVEANFWGKPVILIGRSFYYDMDVAYHVKTKEELIRLLHSKLSAKAKQDSMKYGYYILDTTYRVIQKYHIDINPIDINFCGQRLRFVPYLKQWNSYLLFKLMHLLTVRVSLLLGNNTNPFPR